MGKFGQTNVRPQFDRGLWLGPVAFFIAAWAWSVLDSEFSTDTWMGLAAGRQLLEQLDWGRFYATFPRQDTFSYTFFNQAWFNQNWLSNLGQYWIYDRVGSAGVVYVTWAIAACVQLFVLLAAYWRTESLLAACLAAALVGIGGRDFLEPRAAIVGLLCLAILWALICAIEGQRDRRRWWPIIPLLPLLVFWSNAHGGFVLGYGLLAMYVGHWVAVRLCRTKGSDIVMLVLPLIAVTYLASSGKNLLPFDEPAFLRWLPVPIYAGYWASVRFGKSNVAASGRQILSIAGVLTVAILIAMAFGPFGAESFTHPGKIASSTIYRTISEWQPAYSHVGDFYPPMRRFWKFLGLTLSAVFLLWLAGKVVPRSSAQRAANPDAAPWSLFDVAVVLILLFMTVWARRFAPLLYVLSAPILAVWVQRCAEPLLPYFRGYGIPAIKIAAGLAALVTGWLTWASAQRDLVDAFKDHPETGLLERARGNQPLDEAILFVAENQLRVNLLTDYGDGGSVMFLAPLARVFIDGRSDQLYTEQHFRRYLALMDGRTPAHEVRRSLDESKTDAALIRRGRGTRALQRTLLFSADWVIVLLNSDYMLFLRHGSPALNRLGDLIREGNEWHSGPADTTTPSSQASRAMVLLATSPSNPVKALDWLKSAVDREPALGATFYPTITRVLRETAGMAAATDYILLQLNRATTDATMDRETRSEIFASLADSSVRLNHTDRETPGLPSDLPTVESSPR